MMAADRNEILHLHLMLRGGYPVLQVGGEAALSFRFCQCFPVDCSYCSSRSGGVLRRSFKFLLRPTAGQEQALGEMLRDHASPREG
jgi:hypothetical protein